jgi:hypothetical protein
MNVAEQRQLAIKHARMAIYELQCTVGYLGNVEPNSPTIGNLQVKSLELAQLVADIEAIRLPR